MALHMKERDFLPLRQRQISPRERPCGHSEHCWCHAACLTEPSGSDSLRHLGLDRSSLACNACRN
jgi:hypothetical protein